MLQSEINRPKVGGLYTPDGENVCEVGSVCDVYVVVSWDSITGEDWTPFDWPNRCIERELFDECFVAIDREQV